MRRDRVSILQRFYAVGGVRAALRGATYLASWGPVYEMLGRVPTVDEYCDFWKESRTTAWRESSSFEKCCPEYSVEEVWLSMPESVRKTAKRATETQRDRVLVDVASARWAL